MCFVALILRFPYVKPGHVAFTLWNVCLVVIKSCLSDDGFCLGFLAGKSFDDLDHLAIGLKLVAQIANATVINVVLFGDTIQSINPRVPAFQLFLQVDSRSLEYPGRWNCSPAFSTTFWRSNPRPRWVFFFWRLIRFRVVAASRLEGLPFLGGYRASAHPRGFCFGFYTLGGNKVFQTSDGPLEGGIPPFPRFGSFHEGYKLGRRHEKGGGFYRGEGSVR